MYWHDAGHMTKMAAIPIYSKTPSKSSSPEPGPNIRWAFTGPLFLWSFYTDAYWCIYFSSFFGRVTEKSISGISRYTLNTLLSRLGKIYA